MTRLPIIFVALSIQAFGQFGAIKVKWTCPKEGRFSVKHCEGCNPHYCMDGQHFYANEGPVPAWVLNHFAELDRRSEEIRQQIDANSRELRAANAANMERNKQMHAKHAAEHEAFLRRVQTGQRGNSPRMLTPAPGGVDLAPQTVVPPKLVAASDVESIKVGDSRADVIGRLGTPVSAITIPGDEGTTETLSYRTAPDRTVRINLRQERVVEILLP